MPDEFTMISIMVALSVQLPLGAYYASCICDDGIQVLSPIKHIVACCVLFPFGWASGILIFFLKFGLDFLFSFSDDPPDDQK